MSNQDLINRGAPASLFLPGTQYWRTNRSYRANASLLNFDPVSTNPQGSTISLEASKEDLISPGITFGASRIQMSPSNDAISAGARKGIKLSQIGLEIQGRRDSYYSPTAASLMMGDGNNSISIGKGKNNWQIGIRVGTSAELSSGSGVDSIRGAGVETGISVIGKIQTGGGNDLLEGRSVRGAFAIHIDNPGVIDMGDGDDRIIGRGGSRSIYISGRVVMGQGKDSITGRSLHVNSCSGAQISMGDGDDSILSPLVSANNARFDFGNGTDRLSLRPGSYNVRSGGSGVLILSGNGINNARISGLEFLVSSATGKAYDFESGNVLIS